ncbi:hypothetical protein H8957_007532 [Semnopithecus entellus]
MQHNRFYHEETNIPIQRNTEEPKTRFLRVGNTEKLGNTEKAGAERSPPNRKHPDKQKATDDYHYKKVKKMNRQY